MSDGDKNVSTSDAVPRRRWRFGRIFFLLVLAGAVLGGGGWASARFGVLPSWVAVPKVPSLFSFRHEARPGALPLAPFTVNLADTDSSRFLRVSMQLVIDDEAQVKKVEVDPLRAAQVRSAVLELLTQQTAESLNTPEGKTALKHAIITRASAALQPAKVTDVLFSDFVIQF
jgi:flagellar basal body-associated protein FliL